MNLSLHWSLEMSRYMALGPDEEKEKLPAIYLVVCTPVLSTYVWLRNSDKFDMQRFELLQQIVTFAANTKNCGDVLICSSHACIM
jgi:hypothetical protein